MRSSSDILPLALTAVAAFFLGAIVLLSTEPGAAYDYSHRQTAVELPPAIRKGGPAGPDAGTSAGPCTCSEQHTPPPANSTPLDKARRQQLWPKPSFADLKLQLDRQDALAALEAVQVALTEVEDGAAFIWHRRHGRLSGAIEPTTTFRDVRGLVCRHIVVALTSGSYIRKVEGMACRQPDGIWVLEG